MDHSAARHTDSKSFRDVAGTHLRSRSFSAIPSSARARVTALVRLGGPPRARERGVVAEAFASTCSKVREHTEEFRRTSRLASAIGQREHWVHLDVSVGARPVERCCVGRESAVESIEDRH